MKKIIGILIVSLFLFGAASVPARQDTTTPQTQPQPIARDFTHAVFAEDGTATWCGYCHYAREALDNIYQSHDFPFYYVCLVDDKDTHADDRIMNDYNAYGFPTVWFDGGWNVQLGGYTGNENDYRAVIPQAGARAVADINTLLNVSWLGDGNMNITVSITNNMTDTYVGDLKVYVCEVESSYGWKDTTQHPYTMPFLDWAQNQEVSISGSNTWTNTYNWIGADHNNGYGQNFAGIQKGNIEVIAVVFNNTMHQGYSYPPSGYPYNAYYPDDAIGVQVGQTNVPPNAPSNPNPADKATNVAINQDLSWVGTDPNNDTLVYDVWFGTTNPPPLQTQNQTDSQFDTGTMLYNTTYYWKIRARDPGGLTKEGPVWSFTTGANPDSVPPVITMTKPKTGYIYLFDHGVKRLLSKKTMVIGTLTITANVTDAMSGVAYVEVYIDGARQTKLLNPPFTYSWAQSYGVLPSSHLIKVVATDNANNHANTEFSVTKIL